MKRALVTISIGELRKVHELTDHRMRAYAKQIGAEYIVIDETPLHPPHFAKFDIFTKFASDFDQLLYVDADVYIRKHAPNIFDTHTSAMFSELPHPKPDWLRPSTNWIRQHLAGDWPNDRYFNTGVIVADTEAITLLASVLSDVVPRKGVFFEQEQLNVLMHNVGFPRTRLEQRWNQFCCPTWITPGKASDAFFLHGTGMSVDEKIELLKRFIGGYP